MVILSILIFGFALWLGLYLIARDPRRPLLLLTGMGLVSYAVAVALALMARGTGDEGLEWALRGAVLLPALCWVGALWGLRALWPTRRGERRRVAGVLLVASLFFGLGVGLFFLPLGVPRTWWLLGIGVDLLILGVAIAWLDAFDLGEALWPDALRSFDYAAALALVFGGQVALAMRWGVDASRPMLLLLLATIATAIGLTTFAPLLQSALERLTFFFAPRLRRERAALRATADALPRRSPQHPLLEDEEAFTRLTRRALAHYGELPRLVASPLTGLPLIEQRLATRGVADNPLERASELKALLAESIARLKPMDGEFGISDEWRFYNALYYPYVVGLKPYSRRAFHDELPADARAALEWFQSQVPQRTLYNWQSAAAALVAQDLRALEQEKGETASHLAPFGTVLG